MKALQYGTFVFLALGIVASGFAKVDFSHVDVSTVLVALVPIFAGLAGLCAHPPWAPAPTDPNQQPPAHTP